ncbi:MAG: hypothetical protein AB7V46_22280 [Thermomicrobiales bacterium]
MSPYGAWHDRLLKRWDQMTLKENIFAVINFVVDALMFLLLLLFIYTAVAIDPMSFVFWVPFLLAVNYFRFRQAQRRWAVRPEIRY